MFSRKKAAQRARRMAGQGLDGFPKSKVPDPKPRPLRDDLPAMRRGSPTYDPYRSHILHLYWEIYTDMASMTTQPWPDSGVHAYIGKYAVWYRARSYTRSRSRSASPARQRHDKPRSEFITEFSSKAVKAGARSSAGVTPSVAPKRSAPVPCRFTACSNSKIPAQISELLWIWHMDLPQHSVE